MYGLIIQLCYVRSRLTWQCALLLHIYFCLLVSTIGQSRGNLLIVGQQCSTGLRNPLTSLHFVAHILEKSAEYASLQMGSPRLGKYTEAA